MKRVVLIILGLSLVLLPVTGSAQRPDEVEARKQEVQKEIEEKQAEREARLAERSAKRCEFAQSRLEAHKERVELRIEARLNRYQNIISRLDTLALRIENNDGDATSLRASITELSDLVSQFEADYRLYIAEVRDAVNNACGEEVTFKNIIGKALSALRTAKADAADIRAYIDESLKPLLREVRQEALTGNSNADDTEEKGDDVGENSDDSSDDLEEENDDEQTESESDTEEDN